MEDETNRLREEPTAVDAQRREEAEPLADLRTFLSSTHIPTLLLGRELELVELTPAAAAVMGLTAAHVGSRVGDIARDGLGDDLVEVARAVLGDLRPRVDAVTLGDRVVERRVVPYLTPERRLVGVVVTWFDLVDLRRAVERSEQRLRLAKRAVRLGVYDWDLVSGELVWDERLRELWGVPVEEEITYERFMEGLHPDDREATQRAVDRALDPDGDGRYEAIYRVVHRGDQTVRWIRATGKAELDAARRPARLIGMVEDITDRVEADQELRRSQRRCARRTGARTSSSPCSGTSCATRSPRWGTPLSS